MRLMSATRFRGVFRPRARFMRGFAVFFALRILQMLRLPSRLSQMAGDNVTCNAQRATCSGALGQQLSIFSIWTVKLHANPIKLLTLRPISRRFSFCFAIYFNSSFCFCFCFTSYCCLSAERVCVCFKLFRVSVVRSLRF